ncbi:MAG: hypothetical protein RL711_972, partial [Bacteroidota bacterium]
ILDLSGNNLSVLPSDFGRLKQLKIVFFSNNHFTSLPEALADCPHLEMIGFKANKIKTVSEKSIPKNTRWLILTDNCIEKLPDSIGNCERLQKCMLAGNMLSTLPDSMANCRNLELLRLSANQITNYPEWLFKLPKLAWLAMAGNPCGAIKTKDIDLKEIPWSALAIQTTLGEGASGLISKAYWNEISQTVAVKIFKGEITSDGLPEDEMKASIAVGNHENIVKVLGKIIDHEHQKQGLVFELIPANYTNLAGPPSFETCTRDVFDKAATFSMDQIITIVKGIASAANHIHQRGIMHGDVYAHNVLINELAQPLFGDFGGAMLYEVNSAIGAQLERIEVRAFACLLDDLLQQNETLNDDEKKRKKLSQLRDICWKEKVEERPNFKEIVLIIEAISVNEGLVC